MYSYLSYENLFIKYKNKKLHLGNITSVNKILMTFMKENCKRNSKNTTGIIHCKNYMVCLRHQ